MSKSRSRSIFSWFGSNDLEKEKEIIFSSNFASLNRNAILHLSAKIKKHINRKPGIQLFKTLREIIIDYSDEYIKNKLLHDPENKIIIHDPSFWYKYRTNIGLLYYILLNGEDKKGGKTRKKSIRNRKTLKNKKSKT
jgi:hypothetical protein